MLLLLAYEMPAKLRRCFDCKPGLEPERLREPMCANCTKLWDEERFDRRREKEYYRGFPCTGPPAAGTVAPVTPASPGEESPRTHARTRTLAHPENQPFRLVVRCGF